MKALVFSDLHWFINGETPDSDWVLDAIGKESPDLVIYNGDIIDYWLCPREARDDVYSFWVEFIGEHPCDYRYILGNHDYIAKQEIEPNALQSWRTKDFGTDILFTHGDEADFLFWSRMLHMDDDEVYALYRYFSDHPDIAESWGGWNKDVDLDVFIKIVRDNDLLGDIQGLDLGLFLVGLTTNVRDFFIELHHVHKRICWRRLQLIKNIVVGHYHRPQNSATWKIMKIWPREVHEVFSGAGEYLIIQDGTFERGHRQ